MSGDVPRRSGAGGEPADGGPRHRFETDSVERTLRLVGERWTLQILREAFVGVRRFNEFQRNLSIPRPTLSARLVTLVEVGLLNRVRYATEPDRYEYVLTGAGHGLFPAVATLMRWGDTHLAGPAGPPVVLRHVDCGEVANARLCCGACGGEVTFHNVAAEPGPSFTPARTPGAGEAADTPESRHRNA